MTRRFNIRVDKRYSAISDYKWLRLCGFTRREAYAVIFKRYGW